MKISGTKLTKDLTKDLLRKGNKIQLSNIFIFPGWESDVFNVSKSMIISEYEIKVSRNDFFADFNKKEKHKTLEDLWTKGIMNQEVPNHFYYCVPEGLIQADEVPEYSGLIYCISPLWFKVIKKAPKLHSEKMNNDLWETIAMKLFYKTI